MRAVGCSRPTWRLKEENRRQKWRDQCDRWMQRTVTLRGPLFSTSCYCRFSECVLKDNPIFSPTASTPLLILWHKRFPYSELSMLGFCFLILLGCGREAIGTPAQTAQQQQSERREEGPENLKKNIPSKCLGKENQ